MNIDRIDVGRLDVPTDLPDLRRDIHVFVDYIRNREVKRSHRGNLLSKTDAKRLAKLMSDPQAIGEIMENDWSRWLEFVDDIVLELGFVSYDTKGEYAGYTSHEPSFPDNYIAFLEKPYQRFLTMSSAKQESTLLDLLLPQHQGSGSEFYNTAILGRLEGFNHRGSALGVMPMLDFTAIRRFLLDLLSKCPSGEWLSTASLIEYLKAEHRYFLIPKKPQFDKRDQSKKRYGNFHESKERWGHENDVSETDEDAFERVEGRYVERFLEGIPLLLGYVDVAYAKHRPKAIYPSIGELQAFRVSQRLRQVLSGQVAQPRVTVTPSFDVFVHADVYPASVLSELSGLCEPVSEDNSVITLKLTKQKVAAARAADSALDVTKLLQRLTASQLPANVARELSGWEDHGEKFALYSGYSLLEADDDHQEADPFTVERIAPGVRLVHSPDKLFAALEKHERVPLRVKHGEQDFVKLPKTARTRFPKKASSKAKPSAEKPQVTLMRVTRVQLLCPDRDFLDKLQRILLDKKCPVEADRKSLTLAFSKQYESDVTHAIRTLRKDYKVKIEDTG